MIKISKSNCIFCKIIRKEIPSKILFENTSNMAFLDVFPISQGHTIVVPKNHYQNIEEIPDNELSELFKIVKKLAVMIHIKLNVGGYNILQNNFKPAGQDINHVHVHIIPRNENDKIFKLKSPPRQENEKKLENVFKKLIN